MLLAGQAEHLNCQRFNGTQQFTSAFQHQGRIGSRKFDQNLWPFPIALLRNWRVHGDPVLEVKTTVGYNPAQKCVDFFCRRDFVRNGHWLPAPSY